MRSIAFLAAAALLAAPAPTPAQAQEETFAEWMADFRDRAIEDGRDRDLVDLVLDDLEPIPQAIELDRDQPEFVRPIWEYLDSAVSASRVETGRGKTAANAALLSDIEARYGVDAPYFTAIWGLESAFGEFPLGYDAPEALATLAWEGRRRDYFEDELFAVMEIIDAGYAERDELAAGWAGAMGQTQFMPRMYLARAVDHDGDGKRNIWEATDALASTANYMSQAGWRPGEPWGVEVRLREGFDFALADGRRRGVGAWAVEGVTRADGELWDGEHQFLRARLLIPAGAHGPAFLTFDNFEVFKRYNNATSYALAAGLLGDAIAGEDGVKASWPRHEQTLTRTEIEELQGALTTLGYDTEGVDGRVGPRTQAAIRAFQGDRGMPADAFATAGLLALVRDAGAAE